MFWLDNARVIAIFTVILLHVSVGGYHGEAGTLLWYYTTGTDVLVRCCVPLFVMVSGSLLLESHGTESLKDFYKKRMAKVLVPILLWSMFYIVWGYFRENVQEDFTVSYVIQKFASGKPYYHLWYMYMLLGLYAFTPVFRVIVTHLKMKELMFFVALTFGIKTIHAYYEAAYVGESNLFLTWFLTYVPFYFMGYIVRHYELPVSTAKLSLWALFLAILGPTLACYIMQNVEGGLTAYFFNNLNLMNIIWAVSAMFLLRRLEKPLFGEKLTANLAKWTFGIYLLHMVPLAYIHDAEGFWSMVSPYAYTPLFSLAVFVSTALLTWALSHVPVLKKTIS